MSNLNGKLVWRGMDAKEAMARLEASGKWEYIAEGDGWFWVRSRKFNDVIEVQVDCQNTVVDIDIL